MKNHLVNTNGWIIRKIDVFSFHIEEGRMVCVKGKYEFAKYNVSTFSILSFSVTVERMFLPLTLKSPHWLLVSSQWIKPEWTDCARR